MKDCCSNSCHPAINNRKGLKIALGLVGFTVIYNIVESVFAIQFGFEAESIALVGFGADSLIEISAGLLLFWRLLLEWQHRNPEVVEQAETRVHRFVGISFILLASYVAYESGIKLIQQEQPEATLAGIVLALLSLIVMPLLAWGKIRTARNIGSTALEAEAKETIACSILSAILLTGLVCNALFGWWWADPVASLCMIPWLLKEGIAGIKGEGCCG